MRVIIALFAAVLVVVVLFVSLRTQSNGAVQPIVSPAGNSVPGGSVASADLTADSQAVRTAAIDKALNNTAAGRANKNDASGGYDPSAVQVSEIVDGNGAPIVVGANAADSAGAVDTSGFLKKYGDYDASARQAALEEIRLVVDSVTSGADTSMSAEAVAELKREMSWLETHGGS